ncbi:hypothetical protein E2C01_055231 [Portunus trituberculatus]|uniref:Uncharacterized protein n=1 Tax=Portunus trituberculatus TaxID=210409 RepID=A0A5B7GVE4_PORTR|nr:hypothetical protein [Portunus trituberculatus]
MVVLDSQSRKPGFDSWDRSEVIRYLVLAEARGWDCSLLLKPNPRPQSNEYLPASDTVNSFTNPAPISPLQVLYLVAGGGRWWPFAGWGLNPLNPHTVEPW